MTESHVERLQWPAPKNQPLVSAVLYKIARIEAKPEMSRRDKLRSLVVRSRKESAYAIEFQAQEFIRATALPSVQSTAALDGAEGPSPDFGCGRHASHGLE